LQNSNFYSVKLTAAAAAAAVHFTE